MNRTLQAAELDLAIAAICQSENWQVEDYSDMSEYEAFWVQSADGRVQATGRTPAEAVTRAAAKQKKRHGRKNGTGPNSRANKAGQGESAE